MKKSKAVLPQTKSWPVVLSEILQRVNHPLDPAAILRIIEDTLVEMKRWQRVAVLAAGGGVSISTTPGQPEDSGRLLIPIQYDGQPLGQIELEGLPPEACSAEDQAGLQALADLAGLALRNAYGAAKRPHDRTTLGEQKLAHLLEILPVGVSVLDAERRLVFENPALERILEIDREGLERSAYRSRTYLAADGSRMQPQDFASARAAASGQPAYNVETGVVKEDGATVWASVSAVPVDFPDWKTVIVTADVTARKQAELLAQSQQRNLEALVENTDGSIWSVDREYRLIIGNSLYHQNTSAVLGRHLSAWECVLSPDFPQAALDEWRSYYDRALNGERFSVEVQTRFAAPAHYVEYRFNPIVTAVGTIAGVTVYGRDISESKRNEIERARLAERLDLATHSAGIGIWDWDILKNELDWDDQMYRLYGLEPGQFGGAYQAWLQGVHPDDRAASDEISAQARRSEREYDTEYRVLWPDGSVHWLKAQGQVFRDEAGVPLRMVGVNYDITERKQAEEALQKLTNLLAEGQRIAHVGSFEYHAASRQTTWSEEEFRIYGYDPAQPSPDYDTMLANSIHPEDAALLDETFRTAMQNGSVYELEHRIMRSDGSVRWVHDRAYPNFDQKGRLTRYIGVSLDITERKALEESLRESEQRYSTLFEKSTVPTVLLKLPEVVFADANEAAEQLSGYTRQELLGKTSTELGLLKLEERRQTLSRFSQKGALQDEETRLTTKSGEQRILLVNTMPLQLGGQLYAISTLKDITERKQAEAVIASLAKFPSENPNPVIRLDGLGTVIYANAAGAALLNVGVTEDGQKIPPRWLEIVTAVQSNGQSLAIDWETQERTFLCHFVPIYPSDYVNVYAMDITARKQAEEALRQSQQTFTQAFDANPAALAITRQADGKIIRTNAAYTRILGYQPEELAGRTPQTISIYADPTGRQELLRLLQEQGFVYDQELPVRTKWGELRSLVINLVPLRFEDEDCILSALLDITERRRVEDELRRSNSDLEQFAYIASHDLQEPLRSVAGMVELLRERYQGQMDERADTYISLAVDGAQRMQQLINDLLQFSRVNRFGKPFEAVQLEDTLRTALSNLRAAIQESGAQITWDLLPTVRADPVQMAQVLQNLVGNAIKFRSPERPLQIHIGARKIENTGGEETRWQISISDNGIGIKPQYFERIFLVFQRLHTRREYSGTGIGLAVCKKIIERHGGKIWVESAPQQGSTFFFTIPDVP